MQLRPLAETEYITQVFAVIISYFDSTVCAPKTQLAWRQVMNVSENVAGFPNVVAAIDGSLFLIQRFGKI
jgi:hypothetical protein